MEVSIGSWKWLHGSTSMLPAPKFATVSCMLAWSFANRKVCCFPSYLGFMMPSFCANGCDEVLVMLI